MEKQSIKHLSKSSDQRRSRGRGGGAKIGSTNGPITSLSFGVCLFARVRVYAYTVYMRGARDVSLVKQERVSR